MTDFLVALGLLFVLEGTLYALMPGAMKNVMRQALELPDNVLRFGGLGALASGVLLVWLVHG